VDCQKESEEILREALSKQINDAARKLKMEKLLAIKDGTGKVRCIMVPKDALRIQFNSGVDGGQPFLSYLVSSGEACQTELPDGLHGEASTWNLYLVMPNI